MKNKIILILIFTITVNISFSQTNGTLTVSTTTSDAGGNFKPRHIMAVWIEDDSNNFVKTLLAYAERRRQYLYKWKAITAAAGSQYNIVDAISGATRNSHDSRTCSWDGTDVFSTLLKDGTYTVHMELTDKHAQGNYSTFTFTKGPDAQTLTPDNKPSFSNISIEWKPTTTFTDNFPDQKIVIPNPASNVIHIDSDDIEYMIIMDLNGKKLKSCNKNYIDISDLKKGIYLVTISTADKKLTKRIVIN